jgi:hypothetical protein
MKDAKAEKDKGSNPHDAADRSKRQGNAALGSAESYLS